MGNRTEAQLEVGKPRAASTNSLIPQAFHGEPSLRACSACGGPNARVGQYYCHRCHAAYMRATRPRHSELAPIARLKANCRSYANVYQRRGLLKPKPCERCGSADAQKHHPNYSLPLRVRWLCRRCHLRLHRGHHE